MDELMQRYPLLAAYRRQIILLLVGLILIVGGIVVYGLSGSSDNSVQIVENADQNVGDDNRVVVEVSGAVGKPGVYTLSGDGRVEDALEMAGGVTTDADTDWMDKVLNRASKVVDGQKIYIPKSSESEDKQSASASATNLGGSLEGGGSVVGASVGMVNINTASQKELEALSGIGPVYAQNIIEHRPYSTVEELKTKKILNNSVYEKNKDKLTVY